MRAVLFIGGAIALSACAPPPIAPAKPPTVVDTKAPRCASGIDCDRKWLSAQETLQAVTGMRLRIVTDTRLETFAATGYGRMGGQVLKYPLAGGTYELRVQLECYRRTECDDVRNSGINLFNRTVGGADSMKQ